MRPPTYSIETLREFFKVNIIATMKQLKAALGTAVDMTVYRKLRLLSYLTSYSHQGKYYSLSELARFDSLGMWKHDDARFSQYGTLINTAQALISLAEKGYTLSELRQVVGCEVKETLPALVRQRRIPRELIDGQFVYFAASPEMQKKQHLARLEGQPRFGAEGPDLLAHETRSASVCALTDGLALRLTKEAAFGHPPIAAHLLRNMARMLAVRLTDADDEIILHRSRAQQAAEIAEAPAEEVAGGPQRHLGPQARSGAPLRGLATRAPLQRVKREPLIAAEAALARPPRSQSMSQAGEAVRGLLSRLTRGGSALLIVVVPAGMHMAPLIGGPSSK